VLQFDLRAPVAADAAFIYAVCETTMRQHVESAGRRWATEGMREKSENDALDANTKVVFTADQDIGVYSACVRDGAYCIDMLFLLPAFQRHGVGSALLAQARLAAASARLPMRIQVITTNPAKAFWESHGFKVTGLEDPFFYIMQSAA
jgi:GNAT superfamily N-acetyltransferase